MWREKRRGSWRGKRSGSGSSKVRDSNLRRGLSKEEGKYEQDDQSRVGKSGKRVQRVGGSIDGKRGYKLA